MELENSFVVPSDIETAWQTLLDVEAVAPCMPGATLTSVDGDAFTADVKVKLGPVLMTFGGEGAFVSKDEAARTVVIHAKGKEKKGSGTATALVTARLEPTSDTTTTANIVTDLTVTGKAAQFGRGVMVEVSKHLIGQFAGNLEKVIVARKESAPASTSTSKTGDGDAVSAAATPATAPAPLLENAPLDLGAVAMGPVLKRAVPALGLIVAVVVLVVWLATR